MKCVLNWLARPKSEKNSIFPVTINDAWNVYSWSFRSSSREAPRHHLCRSRIDRWLHCGLSCLLPSYRRSELALNLLRTPVCRTVHSKSIKHYIKRQVGSTFDDRHAHPPQVFQQISMSGSIISSFDNLGSRVNQINPIWIYNGVKHFSLKSLAFYWL